MAPILLLPPLLTTLVISLISPSSSFADVSPSPLSNNNYNIPSPLIQHVCDQCSQSTPWNSKFCTDTLSSHWTLSSATDLPSMAVSLSDIVATNATAVRRMMLNAAIANGDQRGLRQQGGIDALAACVRLYDAVISQINEAAEELRQRRYVTADGEFLYANYLVNYCNNFLSGSGVNDSMFVAANDVMSFFIYVLDWTAVEIWTGMGFQPNNIGPRNWKLGPKMSFAQPQQHPRGKIN